MMACRVFHNLLRYRWIRGPHSPCYFLDNLSQCVKRGAEQHLIIDSNFISALFFSQNASPQYPGQKKKRPKSSTYIKITVIESDGNLTVTSLEEAEKLAKRRDLKLVKLVDKQAATQRPVYKMMTAAQYFEDELASRTAKAEKKKTETKGEKIVSISDKIQKHDLESKEKIITKWLEKRYEVRVVINESEDSLSAQVFKGIEMSVKETGKVVQKRQKGKEIKFSIIPTIKKSTQSEETKSDNNSDD